MRQSVPRLSTRPEDLRAEADGEFLRLHPEPAADEIMAELMHHDQSADKCEERGNGYHDVGRFNCWHMRPYLFEAEA